uniref:Uncharacterized protein n=1 Tax=Oryza glumipatula TaxID=40148 RepID=A0A0D9ZXU2_9ORYZ
MHRHARARACSEPERAARGRRHSLRTYVSRSGGLATTRVAEARARTEPSASPRDTYVAGALIPPRSTAPSVAAYKKDSAAASSIPISSSRRRHTHTNTSHPSDLFIDQFAAYVRLAN